MDNVKCDRYLLSQWLECGYIENDLLCATQAGSPQGGIISPVLANIALDGLSDLVKSAARGRTKVNLVRYADDFIVTSPSPELLLETIKPAIQAFLSERGLSLSPDKTHITHINTGINFLGFNIRKYGKTLLIKPAKESIRHLLRKVRGNIKALPSVSTEKLIRQLNPIIRGWVYYFRHVVSKQVFSYIDHQIFTAIWKWINRRHTGKGNKWKVAKYFTVIGNDNWCFYTLTTNSEGEREILTLFKAYSVRIIRHTKIIAKATPFDDDYDTYFAARKSKKELIARRTIQTAGCTA